MSASGQPSAPAVAGAPAPSSSTLGAASGLANATGEYNCFLNVVLQALYSCERFRKRLLLEGGDHRCTAPSCITCSLLGIFKDMSASGQAATTGAAAPAADSTAAGVGAGGGGVVDPSALRRALDAAAFEVRCSAADNNWLEQAKENLSNANSTHRQIVH